MIAAIRADDQNNTVDTCGHRSDNPNKPDPCTLPTGHLPANIHKDGRGRAWFPYGVHRDGTVDPGTCPEFVASLTR